MPMPQNHRKVQVVFHGKPPLQVCSLTYISRIALSLGLAGAGAYFTLVPAESKQQAKEQIHTVKEQAKGNLEAHKREKEFEASRAPKPNADKASEEGHAKACETNEHKIRHGVFSKDKEFDNHDTRHTMDPSKDFERVKK